MNPAYTNQPPGPGGGPAPPMYGQRPPGPPGPPQFQQGQNIFNGPPQGNPGMIKCPPGPPSHQPSMPPGGGNMPPGAMPPTGKPTMSVPPQFGAMPLVQNGFQNSAGANGDSLQQQLNRPGFPPGPPGQPGQPNNFGAPSQLSGAPRGPPPHPGTAQDPSNQHLSNQMGQMNIGNQPPRPGGPNQFNGVTPPPYGAPPSSLPGPPTGPPAPGRSPLLGAGSPGNQSPITNSNNYPGMPPRPTMPPFVGIRSNTPAYSVNQMPPMGGQPPYQSGGMPPRPGIPPSINQTPGQPGQFGQQGSFPGMPPNSNSGMPPRPGMPPAPGTIPGMAPPASSMGGMPPSIQPGVQSRNRPGFPPMPGMPPNSTSGHSGMPPMSNASGMPTMSSMPPMPQGALIQSQPGLPPMSAQPGMQPIPGQMSSQPGMPPMPGQQPGMPPMPGQLPGMPSMPGQQPGMPPMPGQQTGMPQMPGQQPGMPLMPGQQPGMPSMPGQQPGMPPMPGQPGMPPMPGQAGQYPQGGYPNQRPVQAPQQAPRRLDPDQMPSPIQVIEDDRKNRSGMLYCNAKGQMPPLVTTEYVAEDQGNCIPRYIRSTMYNLPITNDMVKQCHIPMSLNIVPFARLDEKERPVPLVNLGELGPVRCNRCKAYMNPYMTFIDGGRRFQCCYCSCTTEVPAEYFAHLDHTGRRVDCYERPELCLASYEFVATKEYCKNNVNPKPPAFIFMIDVSYNAVKSGLVHLVCERLKNDILLNLPREQGMEESEIRVGFATYTNVIHFYNVKGCLVQPQMMVVADVEDMFVPLVDGFLVTLAESEQVIDCLLEQIPVLWGESRETETILGPVIQAGLDALKSADCAGKLLIFHSSLPTAEAPGKLKMRDDRKLLGTDKEKAILSPSNNFYNKLGQDCVTAGCGVDLFLFPNAYIDLATISEVCKMTGGQVYKYTYFRADVDGDRFIEDLRMNVQRPVGFDAVMRVRTSTGIRPVDFLGNFYMSNTTDVELAVIDSDKSITLELRHDDKLNEADGAYVQAAILYTSITGQRRLRVHNLALNCCTQLADLFRNVETDVLINTLAKRAIRDVISQNPRSVRENISTLCANVLACYRKNCASPSSAGQLILPECMKLLPLYSNCLVKSDALQGAGDVSTDDRSYLMHLVNAMPINGTCAFFYPRLLPMHDMDLSSNHLPVAIRCSSERLQDDGAYLLDNGISMFLWLGHNIDPQWVHDLFGVQSAAQIDIDKSELMPLDNSLSLRVRRIIQDIRKERGRWMKLTIVRQRDKLEPWFQHFLVEDRGINGTTSYVEFLCHIHKEIRNLLS